jgi:hypothetical protein
MLVDGLPMASAQGLTIGSAGVEGEVVSATGRGLSIGPVTRRQGDALTPVVPCVNYARNSMRWRAVWSGASSGRKCPAAIGPPCTSSAQVRHTSSGWYQLATAPL